MRDTAQITRVSEIVDLLDQHILPIRGLRVHMRWGAAKRLPFFHHSALRGFLKSSLDLEIDADWRLRIDPVENGHTQYAAGDGYVFDLFCLGGDGRELQRIIEQLQQPQHRAGVGAFDGDWYLAEQGLVDYFSLSPIRAVAELVPIYSEQLLAAALELAADRQLSIRLVTPLRMRKRSGGNKRAKRQDFVRNSDDLPVQEVFAAVFLRAAHLLRDQDLKAPPLAALPKALTRASHLFWVDDKSFDSAKQSIQLSGALGVIEATPQQVPIAWWQLLLIGQFIGIGSGGVYGLGRYEVQGSTHSYLNRSRAASCWLDLALSVDNLDRAYAHVMRSRKRLPTEAWLDEHGQSITTGADPITGDALSRRAEQLRDASYVVPACDLVLVPKANNSYRPLSIAPDWDAVLQRAMSQVLSAPLDTLFHRHSFGFRRGKSRHQAADLIASLRRKGYKYVFDADIEDFFGSVEHDRLALRLHCLFGDDPAVARIMDWVKAPLRYHQQTYPRRQGLGQGSSLSPLLANLMLDDFDQDMAAADIVMLRFADDFVLLSKDKAALDSAAALAKQSLAEHGFVLNPDKTKTVDLDDGLDFLGFMFVGDTLVERRGNTVTAAVKPAASLAKPWLAKLARQALLPEPKPSAWALSAAQLFANNELPILEGEVAAKAVVFVSGPRCTIITDQGQMALRRDDKTVIKQAWQHIDALIVLGTHHCTTPALKAASEAGCRVYLCNASGRCQSVVHSPRVGPNGHRLWLAQAALAERPAFALPIAAQLVRSRIEHQAELLRLKDRKLRLHPALNKINAATSNAQLLGLEGSVAADFFTQLVDLVDPQWGFSTRQRRPPPDPFNALLSLGYTVLYQHAEVLLQAQGLLPYVGFYHQQHGAHSALASDMVEPFRHVVERIALGTLKRSDIRPEHFTRRSSDGASMLSRPLLRQYLAALSQRLDRQVKPPGQSQAHSLRAHLSRQIYSLKVAILAEDPRLFQRFRLR